jgi:hypothetical protein
MYGLYFLISGKKRNMEIIRFRLNLLRNEGWFRFHTEFSGLAEACGTDILHIDHLFPAYKAMYGEADVLLEVLRGSFITKDTVGADRQRDTQFRGLRDVTKAFLNSLDVPKQTAAVKVSGVIRKYAHVVRKGAQADKTAAIDNLLQDLRPNVGGTDFSEEVHLLGADGWVDSLAAANEVYKQRLAERVKESAGRPDAGRLPLIRAKMDHYYVGMVNVIDTFLMAAPEEKQLHFARALNTCITYYRALLKRRRTGSGRGEEERPEGQAEDGRQMAQRLLRPGLTPEAGFSSE